MAISIVLGLSISVEFHEAIPLCALWTLASFGQHVAKVLVYKYFIKGHHNWTELKVLKMLSECVRRSIP